MEPEAHAGEALPTAHDLRKRDANLLLKVDVYRKVEGRAAFGASLS